MSSCILYRFLFAALLACSMYSAALAMAKQAYVLYREKSNPDYYILKSMRSSLSEIKALATSAVSADREALNLCSRDDYSPSLYLLIELIKVDSVGRSEVKFPSTLRCADYLENPLADSSRWIYFGNGKPPKIIN